MKLHIPLLVLCLLMCSATLAQNPGPYGNPDRRADSVERNGWVIVGNQLRGGSGHQWASQHYSSASELKEAAGKEGATTQDMLNLADAYFYGHHYRPQSDPTLIFGGIVNFFGGAASSLGQDVDKAEEWYRKAVESSPPHTYSRIALAEYLLERAEFVRQEGSDDEIQISKWKAEARKLYQEAADAGDPWALVHLANTNRLEGGETESWLPLYERAARDPDYPNFQAHLRAMDSFLSLGRDDEALALYPDDWNVLKGWTFSGGQHGTLGKFVEFRLQEALRRKAAVGDVDALFRLSQEESLPAAREIAELAKDPFVREEDRQAVLALLDARKDKGNPENQSMTWLTRAAEAGHVEAAFRLAEHLQWIMTKSGWTKSAEPQPEAVKWYRRAAAAGHQEAQAKLSEWQRVLDSKQAELLKTQAVLDMPLGN